MSILGALKTFSPAPAGLKLSLTPSNPAIGGTFLNAEHHKCFFPKMLKVVHKMTFYETVIVDWNTGMSPYSSCVHTIPVVMCIKWR
jgi:hypothetical protein